MRYTEIKNFENEEWRPVAGYEGLYFVSNFGRVKSRYRFGYNFVLKESNDHLRKQVLHDNGYLYVNLCRKSKKKLVQVHRLVAAAFLGLTDGMVVNHIDGCKTNNHVTNLEVVTRSENTRHAIRTGLMRGEMNTPKAVLVMKGGVEVGRFESVTSVCDALNLTHSAVVRAAQGKIAHHKGYTFKYL
jgi:hypothetical protein